MAGLFLNVKARSRAPIRSFSPQGVSRVSGGMLCEWQPRREGRVGLLRVKERLSRGRGMTTFEVREKKSRLKKQGEKKRRLNGRRFGKWRMKGNYAKDGTWCTAYKRRMPGGSQNGTALEKLLCL